MKASALFAGALVTLLLGAIAMPTGLAALSLGAVPGQLHAGIYGAFVVGAAIGGPVLLFLAALVRLLYPPE